MRILLIRFSSLGDVVLATGPLRALVDAFPDSTITVATKSAYAPVFDGFANNVTCVPWQDGTDWDDYLRLLGQKRFYLAVDLHNVPRSRRLCRRAKATRVLRVKKHFWRRFLMVRLKRGLDQPESAFQNYADTLQPVGIASVPPPAIVLSDSERAQATGPGLRLGIGWGARWPTKVVPAVLWQEVLARLTSTPDLTVRVFGLDSDREAISAFTTTQDRLRFEVCCGLPLRQTMVKLSECAAFVSSDSGLMHVAAALGVPTVGLFGPTHPALGFAPVGKQATAIHAGTDCSPCHRHGRAPCRRDRRYCFDEIDCDRVADTLDSYLMKGHA